MTFSYLLNMKKSSLIINGALAAGIEFNQKD